MESSDRAGIAARLRELIGGPDRDALAETAARLGVQEVSLRMSIDVDSPHPTVEVLAAVIGEYGIDPTWLLTGQYDLATHRSAMQGHAGSVQDLRRSMAGRPMWLSEPTAEDFHINDQN